LLCSFFGSRVFSDTNICLPDLVNILGISAESCAADGSVLCWKKNDFLLLFSLANWAKPVHFSAINDPFHGGGFMDTATVSGQIEIRKMTIDDLAGVFHLGEQLFTSDFSPSMYRTWDEYEVTTLFNSDSELCLVAELDEALVGFALGTTVEKQNSAWKYGYLVWIGVKPGLQKGGAGHQLFAEIRVRMQAQGVRMIVIDTDADNEAGINFFKKQGFGNIQQHVYMTLNLAKQKKRKKRKND
jgi:ribosomal protein S18 acetylase RimI-like enzyme